MKEAVTGFPVTPTGFPVTPTGFPVTQTGFPVTQTGFPVTPTGFPVTQTGFPVTQTGFPVTQTGLPVTQTGFPVTQTGFPVTPTRSLILRGGREMPPEVTTGQLDLGNTTPGEAALGSVVTHNRGDFSEATRDLSTLKVVIYDKQDLEVALKGHRDLQEASKGQIEHWDLTTGQSNFGVVAQVSQDQAEVTRSQVDMKKVTKEQPYLRHLTRGQSNVREATRDQAECGDVTRGQHGGPEELARLAVVILSQARLGSIGDLSLCHSLRFLHLGNNYIRRVEALGSCSRLLELDLHSNQISVLPWPGFWLGLPELRALYLHDNPLGTAAIPCLSVCPSLVALTLADTPLSLRPGYRHCAVNCIGTLQALDGIVIADEEVVEGLAGRAWKSERFRALCPAMAVGVRTRLPRQISYISKMQHFQKLLKDIHAVLAHHSAVHVIQRWFRGHLVRARLRKAGGRLPTSRAEERAVRPEDLAQAWDGVSPGKMASRCQHNMKKKKNNFPAWKVKPREGVSRNTRHSNPKEELWRDALDRLNPTSALPHRSHPSTRIHSPPFRHQRSHISEAMRRKKETKPTGQQTVLETRNKGDDGLNVDGHPEDKQIQFRLSGLCARIHESDPLRDLLLTRHEQACDVRKSVSQIHSVIQDESGTEVIHRPQNPTTSLGDRLRRRSMGSHVLAPFEALERVERERERAEHLTAKAEAVSRAHSAKRVMQARTRGFLEEKREVAVRLREADCARMTDDLQRQQRQASLDGEHARARRSDQDRCTRQAELALARTFGTQQAAVGKALRGHDWQVRRQEERGARADVAGDQREHGLRQREIVRTFLQHRQEKIQEQAAAERTQLDARLTREVAESRREAHRRVACLRARRLVPRTTRMQQVHVPKESGTLGLEATYVG